MTQRPIMVDFNEVEDDVIVVSAARLESDIAPRPLLMDSEGNLALADFIGRDEQTASFRIDWSSWKPINPRVAADVVFVTEGVREYRTPKPDRAARVSGP